MIWRLLLIAALLIPLSGCSEDCHKPLNRELGLKDLMISSSLSASTIGRGDTLQIYMVARNPYPKPLDVTFPSTCQEAFWAYDEDERMVSPPQLCGEALTPLHMDPFEVRQFNMRWIACWDVTPGLHTVVAGFNPTLDESWHRDEPITIDILPKEEDVTGVWMGTSIDFWGLPGWDGTHIALTLAQAGDVVSGSFSVGTSTFQIESGLMQNSQVSFDVSYESVGVIVEFSGDVCRDRIKGKRYVVDAVTQEILDDAAWWVGRSQ